LKDIDDLVSSTGKVEELNKLISYKPKVVLTILALSGFTALMEGIGLSFVYPIFEASQSRARIVNSNNQMITLFRQLYSFLGVDKTLATLLLGISVATILRYCSSFAVGCLKKSLSTDYEAHLKSRAMSDVLSAQMGLFDEHGYEAISTHVNTETTYSARCMSKTIEILENILLIIVYVAVMIYVAPFLTVYASIFLTGVLGFLRFVVEPAVSVGTRMANANERMHKHIHAGLYGVKDIKLFNLRERVLSDISYSLDKYRKAKVKLNRNNQAIKSLYRIGAALGLYFLIYMGVQSRGPDLGQLGIFFLAMLRLVTSLSTINGKFYKLEGYLSHFERSQRFLGTATNSKENFGGEPIEEVEEIQFEDVSFSYINNKVIKDVSFRMEKGDTVALVGGSGTGKSTIAGLLARLYQPESGNIISSDRDISNFDLIQWRDCIAVVRQQAYIFNKTLKDNVMMGKPDASEKEMKEACKIAQVDEFVDKLPNGYDSEIGEDGGRLSGGQKQRVSIARALLKDSDILILDEATSDLDPQIESKILNSIEDCSRNYGLMIITHRLAAVKDADTINVLSNGRIVNKGTHKELIQDDDRYRQLYEAH
jgi:subfamily B ATP-binding cassette protein MsbA